MKMLRNLMGYCLNTKIDYALLVCAGEINKEQLKIYAEASNFTIGIDKGLDYLIDIKADINLAIGDFDSTIIKKRADNIEYVEYPPEKDATDFELALDTAVSRGYKSIYILGALGRRMDHAMVNVELLSKYIDIEIYIIDIYNRIRLISNSCTINRKYKYFSILSFTEKITGLMIKGAKYPLDNYTLKKGNSLCISNEVKENEAEISLKNGIAIIIESNDDYVY